MPTEYQLTFTGESQRPIVGPDEVETCAGGCGWELSRCELTDTPDGPMCANCISDLYVTCADCGRYLRFDEFGECDDLRESPDHVDRCRECFERIYSRCHWCGRLTRRDSGSVRVSPNGGDEEYCRDCWQMHWFECEECGVIAHSNDRHVGRDDENLCESCFNVKYVHCSHCGCAMRHGDYRGWEGDPYCERCYGRADTWKVQPWSIKATSFDRVGSTRCYGVEIETECCDDWRSLHGNTEWGCVYECSTPGKEFVSPILQGDEGFDNIGAFCRHASERGWSVDRSCGLHIHLDLSGDSSEECLRMAYAYRRTYPLWKKFVANHRASNSMCGSPQYTCADIRASEHIEDFAEARDRFEFANWRAYIRHGSFEVRLFEGTLNSRAICNWIALHARFMDAVKTLSYDEIDAKFGAITRKNWAGLCSVISDTNLLDYWRRKASRSGYDLPALWEEEDTTDYSGIRHEADRIIIDDRVIASGAVSLNEITEDGRYPNIYDPNSQSYTVYFNDDEYQQAIDRIRGRRPIDATFESYNESSRSADGRVWCEQCGTYH